MKRTGIGMVLGVATGAAVAGLMEVTHEHSNHEDDPIVFGVSISIGAVSGAFLGLVSAFAG